MKTPFNFRRAVLRSLLWYSTETAIAVIGWVYGFGLTVKSWPVLIGTLFLARWVYHTLQRAWHYRDAKERVEQNANDAKQAPLGSVSDECLSPHGPVACYRVRCQLGKACVAASSNASGQGGGE